jgi:hypothetical protein
MTDSPDQVIYRHGTYVPLVGSTFDVERPGGERVRVELVDATPLPGRGESFSLIFRGPVGVALDQRTYHVEHHVLGDFPLFLVPLGPRDDGAHEFEAVINRIEG